MTMHPYEYKLPLGYFERVCGVRHRLVDNPFDDLVFAALGTKFLFNVPTDEILEWLKDAAPTFVFYGEKQRECIVMFEHESELIQFTLAFSRFERNR